jgi:hypothetical protein
MSDSRRGQYRDKWIVTNLTRRVLTISDLPTVPCVDPGQSVDILVYVSKESVSCSTVLPYLVRRNWVSLRKIGLSDTVVVTADTVDDALQPAAQDMLLTANNVPVGARVVLKTSDYTAVVEDSLVLVNASAGPVVIRLPSAVGIAGKSLIVKKLDSTPTPVTIAAYGHETVEGETAVSMNAKGTALSFASDGSNWHLV